MYRVHETSSPGAPVLVTGILQSVQWSAIYCDINHEVSTNDTLKHKVVFIGGFLAHKHQNGHAEDEVEDDMASSEFIEEFNRGGLSVPTMATAFFVHSAIPLLAALTIPKNKCSSYFIEVLSLGDAPLAENLTARRILAILLLKAQINDASDRGQNLLSLTQGEASM